MTAIFCDICKKELPGARKDVNYVVLLDKHICIPCEEKVRATMRQYTAAVQPVVFKDYKETLTRTLAKMTGSK